MFDPASQSKKAKATYKLMVAKEAPADHGHLAGLDVEGGELIPPFSENSFSYTVWCPHNAQNVRHAFAPVPPRRRREPSSVCASPRRT